MYVDDYQTVISHASYLMDTGWTWRETVDYLREPWKWREERLAWTQQCYTPEILDGIQQQAAHRRRLITAGIETDDMIDLLHWRSARQSQKDRPGKPCHLCAEVGLEICDGCSNMGENK